MFSKLYKYQVKELWSVARYFYLGMIGAIILSLLITATRIPGIVLFFNALSILSFILCGVTVGIFTIVYDYQNQQGKRSYFFRSIPARESAILSSRMAYYFTYYFVTVLFIVIGLAIFLILDNAVKMGVSFQIIFNIVKGFVLRTKIIGLLFILIIYAAIQHMVSMMFAITIGSEAKFKRLGIGGPVLVYFLHYIVMQIITLISMLFIPIAIRLPENFDSGFQFEIVFESMMSEISRLLSNKSHDIKIFGIGFIFITFITWIIMLIWIYKSSKNKISLN